MDEKEKVGRKDKKGAKKNKIKINLINYRNNI